MNYFYIEPEVSGSLGDKTIMDTSHHPPKIIKLNYEFEGWLGDDLLESFPCFIITEELKKTFDNSNLSGYELDDVLITKTYEFNELTPNKNLPLFFWLKIKGHLKKDDFFLAKDHRLVVSKYALECLKSNNIKMASVEPYEF